MKPDEPEYKNWMNGPRIARKRDRFFPGTFPKPHIKYRFEKIRQYRDANKLLASPERSSSTTTSGRNAIRRPIRPGAKSAFSGISASGSSMLQPLIRRAQAGRVSTLPI